MVHPVTEPELDMILADDSKRISGDIFWSAVRDQRAAFRFRAPIENARGVPLAIHGWYRPDIKNLAFALIWNRRTRVYALDMAGRHRNPEPPHVVGLHKHRWSDEIRDTVAYTPPDITAGADQPESAWRQFCAEAGIHHAGRMHLPGDAAEERHG